MFNGTLAKTLLPGGESGEDAPAGSFNSSTASHDDMKSADLNPITLTFRGLHPGICPFPLSEMKPSGSSLPIDGVPLEEQVIKLSAQFITHFWLDPSKAYVVRRIQKLRQNRLVEQTDIRYRQHEVCGWLPDSWVSNQFSPSGTLQITNKVEVLEAHLNDPQASEQFDIEFPVGCWVYDQNAGKSYRVKADHTMREVSPNGEELPGSVAQPGASWYRQNQWLLVSLAVVLFALMTAWILRRKRKASHG